MGDRGSGAGETVLVTGAGGSIGGGLARALLGRGADRLVLVDASEPGLYEIDAELSEGAGPRRHVAILGDVGDEALVAEILEAHRPQVIFHAAAFKHVPLMESHPVAAARNNALAAATLARVASDLGSPEVVLVSTDKAAAPASVMGASKRAAELAFLARSEAGSRSRLKALRLGNVLESRGSVVPLFRRQIAAGRPPTVTHPDVRRYLLSLDAAVDLILHARRLAEPGLLVPVLGEPVRILDLARDMLRSAGRPTDGDAVRFIGLRPGDKMVEVLTAPDEAAVPTADPRLRRVEGGCPDPGTISRALSALAGAVERRDGAAVLEAFRALAPGYEPSAAALGAAARPLAEAR
jgi:FlaA1/EpsC-like NDP-sugar epimerase